LLTHLVMLLLNTCQGRGVTPGGKMNYFINTFAFI